MKALKEGAIAMLGALLLCSVSHAQTEIWDQGKSDDGTWSYAGVSNADGDILMEVCIYATKNCNWQMSVATACEGNVTAPVLVNTDTGTASLKVQCVGVTKNPSLYQYEFNWKELESSLKGSKSVGIAIGLQANGFKVYRFSLNGMLTAQHTLETRFFGSMPSKPSAKPAAEVL